MAVRIDGLAELNRKLRELPRKVQRRGLRRAVRAGAEPIRERAEELAPRRTGRLARNIVTRYRTSRVDRAVIEVGPGLRAFYGKFQELGTSRHPARPFLRPAFDAGKDAAVRQIGDTLRQEIERAARER